MNSILKVGGGGVVALQKATKVKCFGLRHVLVPVRACLSWSIYVLISSNLLEYQVAPCTLSPQAGGENTYVS